MTGRCGKLQNLHAGCAPLMLYLDQILVLAPHRCPLALCPKSDCQRRLGRRCGGFLAPVAQNVPVTGKRGKANSLLDRHSPATAGTALDFNSVAAGLRMREPAGIIACPAGSSCDRTNQNTAARINPDYVAATLPSVVPSVVSGVASWSMHQNPLRLRSQRKRSASHCGALQPIAAEFTPASRGQSGQRKLRRIGPARPGARCAWRAIGSPARILSMTPASSRSSGNCSNTRVAECTPVATQIWDASREKPIPAVAA